MGYALPLILLGGLVACEGAGAVQDAGAIQPAEVIQPAPAGQPQMVRRMRPPPPPEFSGEQTRLAMTFEQNIPVVEVSINGRGPYRFAIDTGAVGHGRIRPALAEELGLEVAGEVRAGDGSGRSQARRSYRAKELTLGEVSFRELQLSEMPNLPGRLENVHGILGLQLFANHLLTLDYAGRQFRLERGALPATALQYDNSRGGIVVPLRLGEVTLPTTIDTGNAVAPLIIPASLVERLRRSGEPRRAGVARTAVSTVEIWEVELADAPRVGGMALPERTVRYPALGDNGNLGSLALRSGALRVDQINRRVELNFAGGAQR